MSCLYLALAMRSAGCQVTRPVMEELLARLGSPCAGEFLDALFLLLRSVGCTGEGAVPILPPPPIEEVIAPPSADPQAPVATRGQDAGTREEGGHAEGAGASARVGPTEDEGAEGRYLYGVVRTAGSRADFHAVGVDGRPVFLVREGDMAALVHACPPEPYQSDDAEVVTEWLQAHEAVQEAAMSTWGGVIPAAFDTILKGSQPEPDRVVRDWLRERWEHLERTWQHVEGKAEYDVEISWDAAAAEKEVRAASETIRQAEAELAALSPGLAYLQRQRLDRAVEEGVRAAAVGHARRFLEAISAHCAETRVEEMAKTGQESHLVLKVACLASAGQAEGLGEALEGVAAGPGFSVRFTGPWPPFAFVE